MLCVGDCSVDVENEKFEAVKCISLLFDIKREVFGIILLCNLLRN